MDLFILVHYASDYLIPYLLCYHGKVTENKRQDPPRPKFGILPMQLRTRNARKQCTNMITLYVEENNPLTPDFYNSVLNSLQFHQLRCPCGHSGCLSIHGYYHRSIKTNDGKMRFRICRVKCELCGHTHAILLSSMVPYSQISFSDHRRIIKDQENRTESRVTLSSALSFDESNYRYIIRMYLRHWKQRLLSERISARDGGLISRCFQFWKRQFMQIKCTPNILLLNTT